MVGVVERGSREWIGGKGKNMLGTPEWCLIGVILSTGSGAHQRFNSNHNIHVTGPVEFAGGGWSSGSSSDDRVREHDCGISGCALRPLTPSAPKRTLEVHNSTSTVKPRPCMRLDYNVRSTEGRGVQRSRGGRVSSQENVGEVDLDKISFNSC